MSGAERIIFAFRTLGETGKPAALTQGADAVAPAGQNLVRIALVAHVEHQPVIRRVEHIVDRRRQLDNAKARPQMPARHRNRVDHFRPQFIGELAQLALFKLAQIGWVIDGVEQRRFYGHGATPRYCCDFRARKMGEGPVLAAWGEFSTPYLVKSGQFGCDFGANVA